MKLNGFRACSLVCISSMARRLVGGKRVSAAGLALRREVGGRPALWRGGSLDSTLGGSETGVRRWRLTRSPYVRGSLAGAIHAYPLPQAPGMMTPACPDLICVPLT